MQAAASVRTIVTAAALTAIGAAAFGQQGTVAVKQLTPEAATAAARAAMEHCRKQGYQVGVAVVDRGGALQAFVRDRYAGAHTIDVATNKAWSAASFKIPTSTLAVETQAGRPMSGLRAHPKVMAVAGGQILESGGTLVGAIGVSGAPVADADDGCAAAGIKAIADSLEL
jgi:uncharacterized protein GlcG (DUF336 family)